MKLVNTLPEAAACLPGLSRCVPTAALHIRIKISRPPLNLALAHAGLAPGVVHASALHGGLDRLDNPLEAQR